MNKLVSVIVPVYNGEKYIEICIKSILEQSYDNLEVILIDDGSTDRSGQICDYFAERDTRILVFHIQNGGVCNARNVGLKNMNGEYCILVDSDDAIHKDTLARAVELLETEELDCVIYKYKTIDDAVFDMDVQKIQKCKSDIYQVLDHDNVMQEILIGKKFRMLACNKLYKTSLWKNIEFPVGRKYGDDTSVTYQLMDKCKKIGYLEDVLYFYRMRDGSALHQKVSLERLQLFDSYIELIDYYQKNVPMLLEEAYAALATRMFDFFSQVIKSSLIQSEQKMILNELRKRVFGRGGVHLIVNSKLTVMQRILLGIFFCSINGFLCVYER